MSSKFIYLVDYSGERKEPTWVGKYWKQADLLDLQVWNGLFVQVWVAWNGLMTISWSLTIAFNLRSGPNRGLGRSPGVGGFHVYVRVLFLPFLMPRLKEAWKRIFITRFRRGMDHFNVTVLQTVLHEGYERTTCGSKYFCRRPWTDISQIHERGFRIIEEWLHSHYSIIDSIVITSA